jgi:hypothetical protein
MWRLVRGSLVCYRHVLLISWAIGTGIYLLVLAIIALAGSANDLHDMTSVGLQFPLAILIASMVAGFIVVGSELGEARVRLHLMLPVPLGEVAVARVVVPAIFVLLGVASSHLVFALLLFLAGSSPLSPRHLSVDLLGLNFLLWPQAVLAFREVIAMRWRAGWRRAITATALLLLVGAAMIAVQVVPGGDGRRITLMAGLDAVVMGFTIVQFQRRTAFTK